MLVEGGEKYQVKLVNPNGNREETIKEIAGALDHLTSISSAIFSSIKNRLADQRQQVNCLTQRVASASDHVSAIKGSQKAIRILSPAKYPGELDNSQNGAMAGRELLDLTYKPLISKKIDPPKIDSELERSTGFRFDPPIKHHDDLLASFPLTEFQLRQLSQARAIQIQQVGLGNPPLGLDTVDSFLLFNTADNPYHHYRITGKGQLGTQGSGSIRPIRKGEEVLVESETSEDHRSLAVQNEPEKETDDFYYYPSTLQIPDIDVPEFLPDLPGIVDSFDFSAADITSPVFAFQQPRPSSLSMSFSSSTLSSSSVLQTPATPITTPNFPQPTVSSTIFTSRPVEKRNEQKENTQLSFTSSTVVPPPPPPPPPPPAMAESEPKDKREHSPPKKLAVGGGDDMRSSLMAAIRDAGGAGNAILRSAKDRKYEAKKKKQEEKEKEKNIAVQSSDGPDLMADLKNTLAMRRKGISGIQQPKQVGGMGDIMQKLASTIPAMEDSVESAGFGGGDDDSDDDDWD